MQKCESLISCKPIILFIVFIICGCIINFASIPSDINSDDDLKEKSCMVLTGSYSEKYSFNDTRDGGWKKLIDESGLEIIKSNSLPTAWSFNQTTETPYIFTKFS